MATTLDGVTVADPLVPTDKEQVLTGAYRETLNGTTILDYTNIKWKFLVSWGLLTASQYATLIAKLQLTSSFVFSPPDEATTYTVLSKQDAISVSMIESGGASYYYVNAELVEVV